MKRGKYNQKLNKIINLPQFQKLQNSQKKAKHPVLKKEERVKNILISLLKEGKIDEELYYSMIPRDSQPARLHGLPKVHKKKKKQSDWHCLSPGLHYHKVAVRFLGPFCELRVEQKLEEINNTAQELRVYPRYGSGSQSFISRQRLIHDHETGKLSSTLYLKPTYIGLISHEL